MTNTKFYSSFKFNSKEEFKEYLEKYGYREYRNSRRIMRWAIEPHINFIKHLHPYCNSYQESLYWILNNISEFPKCPQCGSIPKFIKISQGYRKYCSIKCMKSAPEIKEIIKTTLMDRYGTNCGCFVGDNISRKSSKSADLYFETIYDQLHEDDQDCTYADFLDKEFHQYDIKQNKNYFYDFVCTSLKICIEFQGDYWHMNPKKYAPMEWNDVKQMFAIEIWEYDKRKKEYIEEQGYTVSYVWESEL